MMKVVKMRNGVIVVSELSLLSALFTSSNPFSILWFSSSISLKTLELNRGQELMNKTERFCGSYMLCLDIYKYGICLTFFNCLYTLYIFANTRKWWWLKICCCVYLTIAISIFGSVHHLILFFFWNTPSHIV